MNELLRNRIDVIRRSLLLHYEGGVGLPNAVIGSERETFVREFLAKIFPPHLRFVGGAIIDSISAKPSGQVDVAVLLPTAPSFPLLGGADQRLILAENAAAVIEIKSNVSTQWAEIRKTVTAVRTLLKHIRDTNNDGEAVVTRIPIIAVGYHGWTTFEAVKQHWQDEPPETRSDALLVLDPPAFLSNTIHARDDAAILAFIAYLTACIEEQSQISTNLKRYLG